jgi:hypothetical protein
MGGPRRLSASSIDRDFVFRRLNSVECMGLSPARRHALKRIDFRLLPPV